MLPRMRLDLVSEGATKGTRRWYSGRLASASMGMSPLPCFLSLDVRFDRDGF